MPEAVRRVEYFSITVPDRPGEAFRVLQTLVSSGVNLLACTARQAEAGQARIDVVPEDLEGFLAAAKAGALDFASRKSGFLVQGEDRPGALAQTLQRLAHAGINVRGIDAMAAGQGRWAGIIWVEAADVARAAQALGASPG